MTYFPLHQTTCFFIPLVAPCKPLLGETKMRIMLQMLMESFCPVLLAITAGVIFSYPLANVIKIAVDLSNGVQAAIKTQQIIILYLCGMGVVLASSMVMVYQIVRYQPKKILMME